MTSEELLELAREIRTAIKEEVSTANAPNVKRVADLLILVGDLQGKILAQGQEIATLKDRIEAVAKEPRVVINPQPPVIPPAPPANVFLPEQKPRKPRKYVATRDAQGRLMVEEVE